MAARKQTKSGQARPLDEYDKNEYFHELLRKATTPAQLTQALTYVPIDVRFMLRDYYESREAYEYCAVIRDSMS